MGAIPEPAVNLPEVLNERCRVVIPSMGSSSSGERGIPMTDATDALRFTARVRLGEPGEMGIMLASFSSATVWLMIADVKRLAAGLVPALSFGEDSLLGG